MKTLLKSTLTFLFIFLTGYCFAQDTVSVYKAPVPDEGKAIVVFYRPTPLAPMNRTGVLEIVDGEPKIVGKLMIHQRYAYQTDPGEHLFMVIGETADFMSANLEAGKTYYAMIIPRTGFWKVRFSFGPIHADGVNEPKIINGINACNWIEYHPDWEKWANENMKSLKKKQEKYYAAWMSKAEKDRPRLLAEDGAKYE
jgi:hypothetical protein